MIQAICYCADCRKMSNAQTWQVPQDTFKILSGEPKVYTKKSDFDRVYLPSITPSSTSLTCSLQEINSHFCSACGTVLYRTGGSPQVEGMVGIRAGILDDQTTINEKPPQIEVYVDKRPDWVQMVEGAMQMNSKYEMLDGGDMMKASQA